MVRSRIGPFALESRLGSQHSTLFRAIHVQQKLQVALRIISSPMGLTSAARTQLGEEVERLKNLKHPQLPRCFGGGSDGEDVYIAYELIDAPTLASRIAQRGPLPWEMVLQHGLQLCDVIQTLHNADWIHGQITPRQVLIIGDETVRLTGLSTPLQKGLSPPRAEPYELAFRAPEQWDEPEPSMSSDLYALGAVMYAALTGQPPLEGDSPAQVRQAAIDVTPPPVATLVFDCPVWLSRIVDSLLEKDPRKRPFTAAATALALTEARRRAEEGASVAGHAVGTFSALKLDVDRQEAEAVLGIEKEKPRKRKRDESFWESPWVLVLALLVVVGGIAWGMMPPSESSLRAKAESMLAVGTSVADNDARDKYLLPMLTRYPAGEHSDWARDQLERIEMNNAEAKLDRAIKFNRRPDGESQRRMMEGRRYERFGDRTTALAIYEGIVELYGDDPTQRPYVNLARRDAERLRKEAPDLAQLQEFLRGKLDEADALARGGDREGARRIWQSIIDLYRGNADMEEIVERAEKGLGR